MTKQTDEELSEFDRGFVVGLLVGEGSFGGDGKQPQVTLRMHTRHEALFLWLMERFPRSRLYGPYNHGGRSYYQWMARGRTLVRGCPADTGGSFGRRPRWPRGRRFNEMRERYAGFIAASGLARWSKSDG